MHANRLIPVLAACLLAAAPLRAEEEGAKKKPKHKVTQSESYLEVEPIYTTIVGDNRARGMLMVGVGLDVPNEELREEVTRSLPVLRDAFDGSGPGAWRHH